MWCPNQECEDAIELGVPAEFIEGMTHCPTCGSVLVPSMPDWASPDVTKQEWAPCLSVPDTAMLPHIKAILDAAGVPYFVQDEGVQHLIGWGTAAFGFNPITGAPVLMVDPADLERVREMLRDLTEKGQPGAADNPWLTQPPFHQPLACSQCGKALEQSTDDELLTDCYHCGWPLRSA